MGTRKKNYKRRDLITLIWAKSAKIDNMLGGLGDKGGWRDRGGWNFLQFDLWGESYLVCYWNFKLTGVIYEQIYICSRYLKYLPWSWILLQFVSTHRPPAHYFITYAVQVNFFTNICVSLLQKALTGFVHVLSQADLFSCRMT